MITAWNIAHQVITVTRTHTHTYSNLFADYTSIIRYHAQSNRFQNCINDAFAELNKWSESKKLTRNWYKIIISDRVQTRYFIFVLRRLLQRYVLTMTHSSSLHYEGSTYSMQINSIYNSNYSDNTAQPYRTWLFWQWSVPAGETKQSVNLDFRLPPRWR